MELKWKTCLRAGVTLVLVYFSIHYWDIVSGIFSVAVQAAYPLLLGFIMAYIVNILMSFYERELFASAAKPLVQKLKRPASLLMALVSVIVLLFLIIRMILPELGACLRLLLEKIPDAVRDAYLWLNNRVDLDSLFHESGAMILSGEFDWQGIFTKVANFLINGVGGAMGSVVTVVASVFSSVVSLVVGLVFAIYLLLGKDKICRQLNLLVDTYLKERLSGMIRYVLRILDQCFHSFIVGQCMEAVILGVLCILGMLILQMPYATMIGCLIGFTALIPVAGAYIGAAVGAFMIFTVSPAKALVFLIFLVVLQQLEGNLIYPKVVGASIGLPGVWVLAAVTVGGGIMGVAGMLLGVPLAAAMYRILRSDIQKRRLAVPHEPEVEKEE